LCGRDQITDIIFKSHIPNLFIIPSGPPPPNPSELLNGKTLKLLIDALKNKFDFIFIDTPPLQGISDTAIIGKNSDGLFLVAWSGKTQKQSLLKIKNMLESYDIPILGIVLNKVMLKNERHYPYYTKKNNSA
jgi:capsular exopolysaccharide synthesis family protein